MRMESAPYRQKRWNLHLSVDLSQGSVKGADAVARTSYRFDTALHYIPFRVLVVCAYQGWGTLCHPDLVCDEHV
jgi:hypothetical protein